VWSNDCQSEFENIISKLTNAPVLQPLNVNADFYIYTDISYFGTGYAIFQHAISRSYEDMSSSERELWVPHTDPRDDFLFAISSTDSCKLQADRPMCRGIDSLIVTDENRKSIDDNVIDTADSN